MQSLCMFLGETLVFLVAPFWSSGRQPAMETDTSLEREQREREKRQYGAFHGSLLLGAALCDLLATVLTNLVRIVSAAQVLFSLSFFLSFLC